MRIFCCLKWEFYWPTITICVYIHSPALGTADLLTDAYITHDSIFAAHDWLLNWVHNFGHMIDHFFAFSSSWVIISMLVTFCFIALSLSLLTIEIIRIPTNGIDTKIRYDSDIDTDAIECILHHKKHFGSKLSTSQKWIFGEKSAISNSVLNISQKVAY